MPDTITVLMLPGTGWPNGGDAVTESFLSGFREDERYDVRIVAYAAAFGGQDVSFADSQQTGRTAVLRAIGALDGAPVVLAGYSQGAVIMGDIALEAATDRVYEWNIKAVALIADGCRPAGFGIIPGGSREDIAEGYGIVRQRPIPAVMFPVFWVSAWGDPICALPAGNPLRSVADLVLWYSIRSPADFVQWGSKMIDTVYSGRLQAWWNPVRWRRWNSAIAFVRGYLFDGRHTRDYITKGYCEALRKAVIDHLEE